MWGKKWTIFNMRTSFPFADHSSECSWRLSVDNHPWLCSVLLVIVTRGKKTVIFPLIAACLPLSNTDKLLHGCTLWREKRGGRRDVKQKKMKKREEAEMMMMIIAFDSGEKKELYPLFSISSPVVRLWYYWRVKFMIRLPLLALWLQLSVSSWTF